MKSLICAISFMLGSISFISCSSAPPGAVRATQSQSVVPTQSTPFSAPASSQPLQPAPVKETTPGSEVVADLEPEVGIIKRQEQGDVMCYITFIDTSKVERTVGAIFELCEPQNRSLNQLRRLVYGVRNVSDCTSNEPCGKTRRANVVIKLDPVDQAEQKASPDSVVLSNGKWTITIGDRNSWSGVNNTGNLTYRGCDANQKCINLTGGIVTCRQGICTTTWRNGGYTYTLASAITDNPAGAESTLTVRHNDTVLQQITGLK